MRKGSSDKRMLIAKTQMVQTHCTGICVNCIHQNTCTFPKTNNKLFCEEYEI